MRKWWWKVRMLAFVMRHEYGHLKEWRKMGAGGVDEFHYWKGGVNGYSMMTADHDEAEAYPVPRGWEEVAGQLKPANNDDWKKE